MENKEVSHIKQATIQKQKKAPDEDYLEKINAFTRRALGEDEVYIFSMVLCDNEIDRDNERFPKQALEQLAPLFTGKTGIFDHNPKGENQTARIFDTMVITDNERTTQAGEVYAALQAWAYMVRCAKNEDLILEIDAGIKKEVSVGCSVGHIYCSVCGADMQQAPCAHQKGQVYEGRPCWHELCSPTDAYEWSFVAVPAQKEAGVTKRFGASGESEPCAFSALPPEEVIKSLSGGQAITLSGEQAMALSAKIRQMEEFAQVGHAHLEQMRGQLASRLALSHPEVDGAVIRQIASGMNAPQVQAFLKGTEKNGALSQLYTPPASEPAAGTEAFTI